MKNTPKMPERRQRQQQTLRDNKKFINKKLSVRKLHELAKNIQLLVLDVDGVLTDGMVWLGAAGEECVKGFHIHDGLGIKMALQHGIEVAVISGRSSEIVAARLQELGVKQEYVYQGVDDKLAVLDKIVVALKLDYVSVAYVGDDLPDALCMQKVGLGIAVYNAVAELHQQHAVWTTQAKGGRGAVREVCDLLLGAGKK